MAGFELAAFARAAGFSRVDAAYFDEGPRKLDDMDVALDSLIFTARVD